MANLRLRPAHLAMVVFVIGVALAGCSAGSGEGLDDNGRPIGEGGGDVPLTADFDSIQANVFTPSCALSGCHAGAAAPLGLKLDVGNSFALLANVSSVQAPGTLRVKPFEPALSYLIQKLEGTATGGLRMPLGGPSMPQATIDVIRQWITEGALPGSGGTTPAAAPKVVAISPSAGAILDQLPAEITMTFSEDMDSSLVSNATVRLIRSGNDGSFSDGNEVTVTPTNVALSTTNSRLLTLDLANIASVTDDYRLRLVGTGATVLASVQGEILDGDGDGIAGGDFTSTFKVSSILPTLASIQANVFTPTCAVPGCHDGTTMQAGLRLDAGNSFASLVNTPSSQVPNIPRVKPLDADGSYLIQKLDGTAAGSRMPPTGPPFLSQATIDVIRQWINDGADSGAGSPDLITYTTHVAPIFQTKCDACHTLLGFGGHNIATNYDDALLPADDGDCDGLNIGQCTIILIQQGDMPQGANCDGDPAQDTGNPACLTETEQGIVQAWIDGGLPE
jgi:hypothetical protein